jgi:hypothetical protein
MNGNVGTKSGIVLARIPSRLIFECRSGSWSNVLVSPAVCTAPRYSLPNGYALMRQSVNEERGGVRVYFLLHILP